MSAALSLPASPTCALIYSDDALIRRNRIVRKIERRGIVVKKELQANTRRFDFTTVDLVVVIADGIQQNCMNNIESDAKLAAKPVVRLPHQESRGWEALAPYLIDPASREAPTPEDESDDPSDAELYAILEHERDEARLQVQKLTGEIGNVRADRTKAEKERDTAVGRAKRLEADLEQAKLSTGEVQDQRSAWTEKLRTIEGELAASRTQNEKLVKERDAAREAIDRQDDVAEKILKLTEENEAVRKERDEAKTHLRMARAREVTAKNRRADSDAKPKASAEDQRKIKDLTTRLEVAEKALAKRSDSSPIAHAKFDAIAASLKTLAAEGVLTKDEAFDRLLKAVHRE